MESSSSSEEGDQYHYWNNWMPSNHSQDETGTCRQGQLSKKVVKDVLFKSSEVTSVLSFAENSRFGNWVPPMNIFNAGFDRVERVLPKPKQKQNHEETENFNKSKEIIRKNQDILEESSRYSKNAAWKKEVNLDWGRKGKLHDALKCNDGDIIWGIVNLGIFANIKLWVNECGNICGLAEGRISKLNSSEVTYISITNTQLIRKMLYLSGAQWASICETLLETKTTLEFDAFQDTGLTVKTNLEKLWIFVCKRRHFLPDQCMLVKFCGAVKCFRKLQIIPKLLVLDIRSITGKSIL